MNALSSAAILQQPAPGRIPKWLKISAAAVLGLIVLLIAGFVWLRGYVERMMDPEVQWAAIREVIAVDEPPPQLTVIGVPNLDGMKTWALFDPAADLLGMILHVHGEEAARTRKGMLDPDTRELAGNPFDPTVPLEHGTIAVQGRDLRCVRFAYADPRRRLESDAPGPIHRSGPALLVELSRGDSVEFLGFMMVAQGEGSRVEDAQVVGFLKPFHVGPDR